jgi:cation diffusion facilitator CzcD-associated flavoprotein CzcO
MMLTRAGFGSFEIFERGSNVGGVWRDNTYPGAACDVPSHLYSYSFEPHHGWSRRYSPQPEILAYLERCVAKYGFGDRVRLGAEVKTAEFDDSAGCWRLTLSTGEVAEADVLVTACGQLSRPARPDVPGLDRFAGHWFHSAEWDHEAPLGGRRVAVIGTGASAIQFVPAIAEEVGQLTVFQRSAPYVIAKRDREYRSWERWLFRHVPPIQLAHRLYVHLFFEALIPFFTRASGLMGLMSKLLFEGQFRKQVTDPDLSRRLRPKEVMGCKRILISSDWYPTLARPNVEVVTDAITEITPNGVATADGTAREADTIIFGTGFQTTRFLAPMEVRGRAGRDLNEAWQGGAHAYLGLTVAGFPNMFMLYGPNTNLGAGSIIYQLESQMHYVVDAVRVLSERPGFIDVRPGVQDEFNDSIQSRLAGSVWNMGCSNWYVDAAGRNTNNWPGSTMEYRRRTRRLDLADYELAAAE